MDTLALERFEGSQEENTGNPQNSDNRVESNHIQIIQRKPSETAIEKIQRRKLEREEARLKAEAEEKARKQLNKLKDKQDDLKAQYLHEIPRFLCREMDLWLDLQTSDGKEPKPSELLKCALESFSVDEILGFTEDCFLTKVRKAGKINIFFISTIVTVLISIFLGLTVNFAFFWLAGVSWLTPGLIKIFSKTDFFETVFFNFVDLYSTTSQMEKTGLDPIKVLEEALIDAKKENK